MKYVLAALALLAMVPQAKAQEVGTYYLNKSLNKTITYRGSVATTSPAPLGSGTSYNYVIQEPRRDTVCDVWRSVATRNKDRVPAYVQQGCAAQPGFE